MCKIACFVSSHGFGHATRTIALLEELQNLIPNLHPHIFTSVPEYLFSATLAQFTYHSLLVDIGLVQHSALVTDIPSTIEKLDNFLPYREPLVNFLVSLCSECSLVLCDIAPLGIVVAKRLGVPSVLVENFTWDWIYAPLIKTHPSLRKHSQLLRNITLSADFRIQTEPLCRETKHDLLCGPIFRRRRRGEKSIREQLQCGEKKIVLVTLGGDTENLPELHLLPRRQDLFFVFTGQQKTVHLNAHIIHLQSNTDMYHPDLICAADLVVCKTGYSTLAECHQAGARVLAVGRENCPESMVLQEYLDKKMGGMTITLKDYKTSDWLALAASRIMLPRPAPAKENGAAPAAAFVCNLL